ncbi:MAG TPA: chromate transporter [Polyangiales bacterium]|nr:chromate transporter [Polyangiales bacterium]
MTDAPSQESRYSLRDLVLYFLRLGALGFGGPIALVGYMQRDLVETRRWLTKEDFTQGLALAQLAPGPLAAQTAIYIGWLRGGAIGGALVGLAFVVPSFLMVLTLAWLYLRFGGLPWMQAAFYGVGAAVIALIARGATKLVKTTIAKDKLAWVIFAVNALATAWTESELVWVVVGSGFVMLAVRAFPRAAGAPALLLLPPWLVTGLHGAADHDTLWHITTYFTEAGAFVFGSGLAIVPFLRGGVVEHFHWLSNQQFLDAVAVAMITPGPVVITVAFIGYLVAGPAGATLAALGTFVPCYLFTVLPAPYFRRYSENRYVKAFVSGVTAAAIGAIAGAAFVLGKRALVDIPTVLIAAVAFAVLTRFKVQEPLLILAAGVVGLLLRLAS